MKATLLTQKNRYLAAIYKSVLEHKSVREIHRELLKVTINPNKPLLAYMSKVARQAHRLDKGTGNYRTTGGLDILAVAIFDLFKDRQISDKSTVLINSEVRKYESEQKAEILTNAWKENRKSGRIFYVASSHADSAKDHAPYQGKIYVDRFWHNYDTDGSLGEYIRRNGIRTVQWVTGKPVWFITRPNCRHYFTTYTVEQILGNQYKVPQRKIGDKRLQTPRDSTLQHYIDRLRLLVELYKKHPTNILELQIQKTKLLIAKWKKVF